MVKKWSLAKKAVIVTVSTLIIINILTGFIILTLSAKLTESELNQGIVNSLNGISANIDGNKLEGLIKSGNEEDEYYDELNDYLSKAYKKCDFQFLYTIGQFEDGNFYYVVDSLKEGDEDFSAFGELVEIGDLNDSQYELEKEALKNGSAVGEAEHYDDWGWITTSYVTIYNSNNKPVALLAVDYSTDFLASGLSFDFNRISNIIWYVLGISIIVTAVILGIYLRKTLKPMKKIEEAALSIADGNLEVDLSVKSEDEIGKIAKAFTVMADNLNNIMVNINSASEQVALGAGQVSDSSTTLSQGATEQASSIEQLTASIDEISSMTKQNAENSNEAKVLVDDTKQYASQGNVQMQQMLTAMNAINQSSNNISKIIKVIDDIAFQTNILALNAAVEAARAGQHGKGFAVVAEEVRNLAARSAEAAKETTTLIEDSIKNVDHGTKIADTTAEALNEIVNGISRVANLVEDIAIASNEQSIGMEQVSQGINQITEVVQTTSATSEETAAASVELASQAEMLKSQIATFKLHQNDNIIEYRKEQINPEVQKMLDTMKTKETNNTIATDQIKGITLNDSDFGKY